MSHFPPRETKSDAENASERRPLVIFPADPAHQPSKADEVQSGVGTYQATGQTLAIDLCLTIEEGRRLLDYFISKGAAEAASQIAEQLARHSRYAGPPRNCSSPE